MVLSTISVSQNVFFSTLLIVFAYWANNDLAQEQPVHYLSKIEKVSAENDKPVKIDVFIDTYNEDVELVRYSIRDARNMTYPDPDVRINVYVLDDSRRDGTNPHVEENTSKGWI